MHRDAGELCPSFLLLLLLFVFLVFFFFFNDTATTEIYTLSLHDALPISLNGYAITCALQFYIVRLEIDSYVWI